jgi:hypothetical protein
MVRFVVLIVALTSLAAGELEQHHFRVLQSTNVTAVDDPTDVNATETSEPTAGVMNATEPPTMEVNSSAAPVDLVTVPELLSAESDLGRLYDVYRVSTFARSVSCATTPCLPPRTMPLTLSIKSFLASLLPQSGNVT